MSIREYPLSKLVSYGTKGKLAAFVIANSKGCYLYNCRAYNNSASAVNVGLMALLPNAQWQLWQYTDVGPVYTSVTSQIQANTATAIFSGTNNDGFIVQGIHQMGLIGLTVSTPQTGGTFEYTYWNGTGWSVLATLEVPVYTSAADIWIVFVPPQAWVVGGPAGTPTLWSIRVRSTTAPAGAVSATALWTAQFLEFYKNVAANGCVQLTFPDTKPFLLASGQGAGIIPYFSATDATNQVAAYYSITG